MSGFGGATSGHEWSDHEFLENHTRLSINLLHRVGALAPGNQTIWRWEDGTVGQVRATQDQIFLSIGDREQAIRVEWLPILANRHVRPRFLCSGCGCGAYHVYQKAGAWACRGCCKYDHQSRHRWRFNPAYGRVARLRKKLGADPRPLFPLPPRPRWRMSRLRYDRLAAELARAEATAYDDLERLLSDLDMRLKP